jgi:hypothetical protein
LVLALVVVANNFLHTDAMPLELQPCFLLSKKDSFPTHAKPLVFQPQDYKTLVL